MMSTYIIVIIVIASLLMLASLGSGLFCLVRYAKTRKIIHLILGLLMTFILPGLFFCLALIFFVPTTMIVYGPPPDFIP